MKNLTRKLFLSICTLAICAVTLVSTTFAWYTTNKEVDAKGITGTASSYGDASVYISADNDNDLSAMNWSQSVTLNTSDQVALLPVQVLSNGSFASKKASDPATDKDYLEFTLHFKTAKIQGEGSTPLYIRNIVIANTSTVNSTDNLLYKGEEREVAGGINASKYWVDATEALWLNMINEDIEGLNQTIYDLTNYNDEAEKALVGVNKNTIDALTYYNAVVSDADKLTKEESTLAQEKTLGNTGSAVTIANLNYNGEHSTVTFRIFLNGWDKYCFDVCKGQSFTVEIYFTTQVDSALKAQ